MRRCVLLSILVAAVACSHDTGSNSGFGDGGGGEAGGDQTETDGPAASGPGGGSVDSADAGSSSTQGGGSSGDPEASEATSVSPTSASDSTTGGDSATATDSTTTEADESSGAGSSSTGGDTADTMASDTAADGMDACGFPLDGPWLEIEYWQAGVPATSPDWDYSMTAGWGEAQWATQGESWPEVWDLYQNIDVDNDPIGVVATVGSSGTWQLMLGFQDLVAYDYASVCVEGRSVSATASVQYDVYNPLNDCGGSSTMAHDWNMHAEGVDLGQCFVPGGGVQAVRIDTTGGSSSLGIKRVRVILHGATY